MQIFSSEFLEPVFKKILPKSINPMSLLIGAGFVCASLFGCYIGEKFMKNIYKGSKTEKEDLEYEKYVENNSQIQDNNKSFLA